MLKTILMLLLKELQIIPIQINTLLTTKTDLIILFNELRTEFRQFIPEERMGENISTLTYRHLRNRFKWKFYGNNFGCNDAITCLLYLLAV